MTLGETASIWNEAGMLEGFDPAGREGREWRRCTIDTRLDCSGRIFFALEGERNDGHAYLNDAWDKGAEAVVVSREEAAEGAAAAGIPCFLVTDTIEALQELARAHRRDLGARVVAVTGSSGKTTTKELLAKALATRYRVAANPGSYNNHIGVPLTILEAEETTEYLVSEVGGNHLGEIAFLSGMLQPHVGVLTNIGEAHIGFFGSKEAVVEAKSELLHVLPGEGYAVLPADSEYFARLKESTGARVVTFGFKRGSDFHIEGYESCSTGATFTVNGKALRVRLLGRHNALNAACALGVAVTEGVGWEAAARAMASVEPLAGRGRILSVSGVTFLDEAYNANPSSMKASLEILEEIEGQRKIAVLGEMKELGEFSTVYHEELGRYVAKTAVDSVYWFGGGAEAVARGLKNGEGKAAFEAFVDLDSLKRALREYLSPGDVVLIKASRACGLDSVVDDLAGGIEGGSRN